jgi:UDP-3-O-[3-hydroxymyristoyl] glucosamine N-acyltransferase
LRDNITLTKVATIIGIDISDDTLITGINTLKDATKSEVSFLHSDKYAKDLETTQAKAVIVNEQSASLVPSTSIALVVDNPYSSMAELSKLFSKELQDCREKAYISDSATVGEGTIILAGAYIGDNAKVGKNSIIHPNVSIYHDCEVGDNVIIHANTTIGSDGFGFAPNVDRSYTKIYQNGNVVVEDDVEIGANCAIDRAVFDSTIIKCGSKLDNLIHIAHNCIIGEHSVITAQNGIAGSTTLGRNAVLGAQSGIAGHLEIAAFTTVAARSGITKSIKEEGKSWAGFQFFEMKTWLKLQAKIARLLK